MNPTITHSPSVAADPELQRRDDMIGYIARRDQISTEQARKIFGGLSVPQLIRLELEMRDRAPVTFTSDYDPLAR